MKIGDKVRYLEQNDRDVSYLSIGEIVGVHDYDYGIEVAFHNVPYIKYVKEESLVVINRFSIGDYVNVSKQSFKNKVGRINGIYLFEGIDKVGYTVVYGKEKSEIIDEAFLTKADINPKFEIGTEVHVSKSCEWKCAGLNGIIVDYNEGGKYFYRVQVVLRSGNQVTYNLSDDDLSLPEEKEENEMIKKIYVNKKKRTIAVKFGNNEVAKLKCSKDDSWDINAAVALAMAYKLHGNSKNAFRKYVASIPTEYAKEAEEVATTTGSITFNPDYPEDGYKIDIKGSNGLKWEEWIYPKGFLKFSPRYVDNCFEKDIRTRIIEYREKTGISREQLAEKVGCHRNTVYGWETGLFEPKGVYKKKLEKILEE